MNTNTATQLNTDSPQFVEAANLAEKDNNTWTRAVLYAIAGAALIAFAVALLCNSYADNAATWVFLAVGLVIVARAAVMMVVIARQPRFLVKLSPDDDLLFIFCGNQWYSVKLADVTLVDFRNNHFWRGARKLKSGKLLVTTKSNSYTVYNVREVSDAWFRLKVILQPPQPEPEEKKFFFE